MWYDNLTRNLIKVYWTKNESYWKFPIFWKLRPTPTKDSTIQAKSNPSECHIEKLKFLKRKKIFTMWSTLEESFGPQKSHCQPKYGQSV